jgi:hypothetical protein
MRRSVALIAALSLLAFAGTAAAGRHGGPPPFPQLGGTWSHAEINVSIKRQPHTLIIDRGLLVQSSVTQLTLRESDGTTVVVPVGPKTLFTGPRIRPRMVRHGVYYAMTMRIDGGDAVRVRVSIRP